jgi:hypothetical protein
MRERLRSAPPSSLDEKSSKTLSRCDTGPVTTMLSYLRAKGVNFVVYRRTFPFTNFVKALL